MAFYGVVFPEFWTGRTGRELRALGKDAQLLALYLVTNRHTNMLGLYRLLIDDIRHETGLGLKGIEAGLVAAAATDFGCFDSTTSFVWVKTMARFRMNVPAGEALDPDDKKVLALNKLYHKLEPNPFLGEFFDANHHMFRIRKRRESTGVVAPFAAPTTSRACKGLVSPLQASKQISVSVSGSEIRIRDQEKAPRARHRSLDPVENANPGAVRELIANLVTQAPANAAFADLKEDAKAACAKHGLAYDPRLVGEALEQALARRAKAALAATGGRG